MNHNTPAPGASSRVQSSHRAPWDAMDSRWWPDIAEAISGEWPRSACLMDLRWHASQVRLGRLRKMPSRRSLVKRWAWTDHNVRVLLREEAWVDPMHKSPNNLPTISQKSPTSETKAQLQPEAVSQQSPNNLPTISTRADLHNNTPTQEHNNPPTPQGGEPVDKSTKASPVDKPVESVDKSTEASPVDKPVKSVDKSTVDKPVDSVDKSHKADPLKALWQQMEAIRTEHKPGARSRGLSKARRRQLRGRVKEHGAEAVLLVCRWLWTSEHSRAVFLRTQGHEDAILRASKFDSYLDLSREPQTPSQQPAGSKTGADTSGATNEAGEAWERVLKALRIHGPKAPGVGSDPWVFSNSEALADAYAAGILAAAKEAQSPLLAWRLLYSEGGEQNRLWQRRRFEGAFNASVRSARLRGAA